MGPMKKCCICYGSLTLIWVVAFITIITFSLVALAPKLYVQDLYIPFLNNSTGYNSSTLNTSIFMDLKFKRFSTFIALSYVDINITLFYNWISIGYYVHPGFVQGHKKTVHRRVVVEARDMAWEDALQKLSGGSTVPLKVAVATKYRVKRCVEDECSYTQATTMVLAADVRLDGSGREVSREVSRKPTRLR